MADADRTRIARPGGQFGGDAGRHQRRHAGAAQHRPHLAGCVVDPRTRPGQSHRQVASRRRPQRRPGERHPGAHRSQRQQQSPDRSGRRHLDRQPGQCDRQQQEAEPDDRPGMGPIHDPPHDRRQHPGGHRHRGGRQRGTRRRQPAHPLRVEHQRQDHRRHRDGDRRDAHVGEAEIPVVEPPQRDERLTAVPRLPPHEHRQREPDDADRNVDEEDPRPAETVNQHPARQRADQRGDPGRRTPDTQCHPTPVGREDPGDGRQGLRGQQGRADTLDHPRDDQHADTSGQPAPQRSGGEHPQPQDVEVFRPEPVAQAAGLSVTACDAATGDL